MDCEETTFFLHASWLPVRADFDVGIAPSTPSRPPWSRHGGRLSRSARGQRCASASSGLAAGASRRSGGRIFAMPVRMAGGPRRCCCRSWSGVGFSPTANRIQTTAGTPADHATSRGHRYGSNCAQPQSTVTRPLNPLPCHNLPRQRRLIPSSLALCLPDLCTLLNPTPEASLRPVPTLSGLPFASRSSVAGYWCVPVLSLQTLAAADLLSAVPLLLGRLHGDGASAAGVLGPLSMRVHGKRDVQRPRGLSGGSLSFRELPERRSKHRRGSPHPPHRYPQTAGEHDGRQWRRMAHARATGGCRVAARGSVARSACIVCSQYCMLCQ